MKKEYGKDVFSIDYETRENTEYFLKNITKDNDDNIDFYYISFAYKFIKEWFEKQDCQRDIREALLRTLVYDVHKQKSEGIVQIIWYQIENDKNPIDTFIRINLGKISLTNSELIKALFLQEKNFGDDKNELPKLRQLEIANEWDRIENILQDEDIWWFLNKEENNKPAKIEFIFDLICAVAIQKNPKLSEEIGTDKDATFRYFYQRFEHNNNFDFIKSEWSIVTEYFNTFMEWYHNPVWYHYIGFLIYCGENIENLIDLTKSGLSTKPEITNALKGKIKSLFKSLIWEFDKNNDKPYLNLSYGNIKVKEVLLLFNLEYIVKQCESKSLIFKFPFKTFKEEQWDVEHIDSFTKNQLKDKATQIEWLKTALIDLSEEIFTNKNLMNQINSFINDDLSKESFELIQGEIIKLAGEDSNDEKIKNNIGNLTLLDAGTNRSYGNALFPTKRRVIIEKDRDGTFIPICTKNIFLKYFDLKGSSRTKWAEPDIKNYRNILGDTLKEFLPIKPLIVPTNE